MALTQISTKGIKDGTITGTDLATNVDLVDNQKIRFGTGNDLEIFHNGSNSFLDNNTGNLYFRGSNGQMLFRPNNSEDALVLKPNGAVELYHNNSLKFETTSTGVSITGSHNVSGGYSVMNSGSAVLQLFSSLSSFACIKDFTDDLRIRSGKTTIMNEAQNETLAKFTANGAVELYYDNSKKFQTTSTGVSVTGQLSTTDTISTVGNLDMSDSSSTGNNRIRLGTGDDLEIYHNGTDSIISNSTGDLQITDTSDDITITAADDIRLRPQGGENGINVLGDGAIELYHNNEKVFETEADGVKVFDNNTSVHVRLVSSDGDAGFLYGASNNNIGLLTRDGSYAIRGVHDGTTELYYDGNKKFETTSGGVDVTGALTVNGAAIGGGGKVIQVLRTTASMSSTSSGSFQATGLSQNITMTNSANKVLAIATGGLNNAGAGNGGGVTIFRGTANLAHSNDLMASYFGEDNSNNIEYTATFQGLDTPGAGTHTYTVQLRAFSGTQRFGYRNTGVLTLIELDYS